MRRSHLRRYTPLRSKAAISAGARFVRPAPKPTDDPAYLARVRALPCAARFIHGHTCIGPVVAHHAGRHGVGMKCPDAESIPLCSLAHTCLHDLKGSFTGWTRAQVREWENVQIAVTQAALRVPLTVTF